MFVPFSDVELPTSFEDPPKVARNFPPPEPEYTSSSLFLKHLMALEIKRFHHAKRNKKGMFCEVSSRKCQNLYSNYFCFGLL